jgi:hypothetical protein
MRRCIPKADRTHPPSLRGNNFWENRRRHCSALPCVAQPGHFQPFRPLNGWRPGKLKASSGGAVGMEGGAAAAGMGTGSYGGSGPGYGNCWRDSWAGCAATKPIRDTVPSAPADGNSRPKMRCFGLWRGLWDGDERAYRSKRTGRASGPTRFQPMLISVNKRPATWPPSHYVPQLERRNSPSLKGSSNLDQKVHARGGVPLFML